jgi:hypothetical protein
VAGRVDAARRRNQKGTETNRKVFVPPPAKPKARQRGRSTIPVKRGLWGPDNTRRPGAAACGGPV